MKAKEIIELLIDNEINMNYIRSCARREHEDAYEYFYEFIKEGYGCHGNTAHAVARYFIY